ncbi:hypothetical protein HS088_TW21G00473 [Tripterygium wilfordii]|uniref:Uncharacterized protein n=1 Tax=Tripterygium wilfordii TaxID=458696 RepID=A0A7J7C3I7_TRIWF|nr:hypothetical protein HS088_TW21G00473 [Tripterygium wilfordii]
MALILILMIVMVLDFVAFALALVAEQWRSTAKVMIHEEWNFGFQGGYSYCVYDSNMSTVLGITASALLLASQVLTLKPSCWCCNRKTWNSKGSSAFATVLLIICWLTFFIAEACLLVGSVIIAYRTKEKIILSAPDTLHCQTLRKGVFEAGASFVLLTSLASKSYHVCYADPNEDLQTNDNGENSEKLVGDLHNASVR